MRGLALGALANISAWWLLALLDSIHLGNPDTGIVLILTPLIVPIGSMVFFLLGLPIFLTLRKIAPLHGLSRLAFTALALMPLVFGGNLLALSLIREFISQSLNIYFSFTTYFAHLQADSAKNWRGILLIALCGGLACWCADQAFLLWSDDPVRRRRARIVTCLMVASMTLPFLAFAFFNQYVVISRTRKIAGERPYCILIPSYNDQLYKNATKHWHLSPWKMRASYELVSGSRGGFYDTNHALLVLDNPREYMNWSYRSEDFLHDPLLNRDVASGEPRGFKPCEPKRDFAAGIE